MRNKVTARVREIAQAIVEDPDYVNLLKTRIKVGDAPHMELLLWHYAYGKPKEVVEHQGELTVGKVVREIVIPTRPHNAAHATHINQRKEDMKQANERILSRDVIEADAR